MAIDARISVAAGALLKDPAFKAACEKVEEKYTDQWRNSAMDEHVSREAAYGRLRALVDMLRTLREFWETGEAEIMKAAKKARIEGRDL